MPQPAAAEYDIGQLVICREDSVIGDVTEYVLGTIEGKYEEADGIKYIITWSDGFRVPGGYNAVETTKWVHEYYIWCSQNGMVLTN